MNVIETDGLTKLFGKQAAVDSLNLQLPQGQVFALLGPNGAGKSTLIKLLLNLQKPSAGRAQVLGVDSRKLGPAQLARIGYVADGMQLPEWMTVQQLLDYCRPLYPTWDAALEKKLLNDFELPAGRKLKHLSRGMRMKCALIAALAYRPELLVLDEPFSGLDPLVRDDFLRGLIETSAQGEWTIFISSHDIEDVERLADWIGFIENGRLRFAEQLESIQRRIRKVEVTCRTEGAGAGLAERPKAWLNYEEAGTLTRFVDSAYAVGETERLCEKIFPGATVAATPLPLREIYLTLARASRGTNR